MNSEEFEGKVLDLWTKTRIPLTRANLLARTKLPRIKLDRYLDEMVRGGLLELDSDDEGELLWKVRGARRATSGPDTLDELDRKERLSAEVDKLTSGANIALRAAGLKQPRAAAGGERKSVLASAALSFFLGPVGWLYAAPLKEAIPAIVVYVLAWKLLPFFLLAWIMGVVNVGSALAGALYAWSYNHEGRRAALFGKAKRALPPLRR